MPRTKKDKLINKPNKDGPKSKKKILKNPHSDMKAKQERDHFIVTFVFQR